MTTLHEILYTINTKQQVVVTDKYNAVVSDGITSQKMECFTGYPSNLLNHIDSETLKHLASITGVEDGVIQITSHPAAKLNNYKAYYTTGLVRKNANIIDIVDIEAVNLNDALRQAWGYFDVDSDRKLIGVVLINGIG